MKIMSRITALAIAAFLVIVGTAGAVPVVSNVEMAQITGSRRVLITYDLADEDAIVTLSIETNGVAIPNSAVTWLTGDINKVVTASGGQKSIIWNAGADWPENVTSSAKARVTAWRLDAPPQYCAIDVINGKDAVTYPVYYYTSADGVPGGVTNDLYKTTQILMRKIPATGSQGFQMGARANESYSWEHEDLHDVVLSKDYYAGVYEVTQSQWQRVMDGWPSMWKTVENALLRPVESISYYQIRENPEGSPITPNWPQANAVHASSFMGKLCAKTGLAGFDLPTEAQWEYACRAGTIGALNNGTMNLTSADASDPQLDLLGCYAGSSILVDGTAHVGSYLPNAWGLYDMHGNVFEFCLDWWAPNLGTAKVEDPAGANSDSGEGRIIRGGAYNNPAYTCRSAYRNHRIVPYAQYGHFGFRLFRNLP